jgi:hypothetical protein
VEGSRFENQESKKRSLGFDFFFLSLPSNIRLPALLLCVNGSDPVPITWTTWVRFHTISKSPGSFVF